MKVGLTSLPWLAALALLLPLVSALVAILFRKKFSWLAPILSTSFLFAAATSALLFAYQNWALPVIEYSSTWWTVGNSEIDFTVAVNPTTLLLFALVPFISFLVHVYSMGYMVDDAAVQRYFAMLGFFTFAMLGLVISGNLLQMFFFWELVGISSYFLIGHWRTKEKAAAAATKAFLMNRVGDAGFLVGLALIWAYTNTLDISSLSLSSIAPNMQTLIGLCLFLGVVGKSAQFPLLTWLPDAMEGPTPVSALIHAATMVAAGVFLLIRVHFIFTPTALSIIALTGAITSVYGAWHALRHFDIKKILAYSTLSQLGLMVMAVGAGAWAESLLHLFTHAFFKACLFLCAGAIIHSLHVATPVDFDPQDIRNMGGLRKHMPNVFIAFSLSAAALAGLPFFSGFVSKEAILATLVRQAETGGAAAWLWMVVFLVVSFLTVCYTFRAVFTIFFGEFRAIHVIREVPRTPSIMVFAISILSLLSLWFVAAPFPYHSDSWILSRLSEPHSMAGWMTGLSVAWILLALIFSYFIRNFKFSSSDMKPSWIDRFYQRVFVQPLFTFSRATERTDRKWIDGALHMLTYTQVSLAFITAWFDRNVVDGTVHFTATAASGLGSFIRSFGGGSIQGYLRWAVMVLVIFLFWMLI